MTMLSLTLFPNFKPLCVPVPLLSFLYIFSNLSFRQIIGRVRWVRVPPPCPSWLQHWLLLKIWPWNQTKTAVVPSLSFSKGWLPVLKTAVLFAQQRPRYPSYTVKGNNHSLNHYLPFKRDSLESFQVWADDQERELLKTDNHDPEWITPTSTYLLDPMTDCGHSAAILQLLCAYIYYVLHIVYFNP